MCHDWADTFVSYCVVVWIIAQDFNATISPEILRNWTHLMVYVSSHEKGCNCSKKWFQNFRVANSEPDGAHGARMRDIRHFWNVPHGARNPSKLHEYCAQMLKFPRAGGPRHNLQSDSQSRISRQILISKSNTPDRGKCVMYGPTPFCKFALLFWS